MRRTIPCLVTCLMVALACTFLHAAAAEEQKLPTAQEVIDRYIQATGGREAYEKIKTRIIRGRLASEKGGGIDGTMVQYQTPQQARCTYDLGQVGKIDQGVVGDTVWEVAPTNGARLMKEPERSSAMRSMVLNTELQPQRFFDKMETVGVEKVNEKPAYKVEIVTKGGSKETHYYDKDSGLLVKVIENTTIDNAPLTATTTYEDYREVDGVKIAFKWTQTLPKATITTTFDRVESNVALPQDIFDPPAEAKALMTKSNISPTTKP